MKKAQKMLKNSICLDISTEKLVKLNFILENLSKNGYEMTQQEFGDTAIDEFIKWIEFNGINALISRLNWEKE
jgi:hypothetical protein